MALGRAMPKGAGCTDEDRECEGREVVGRSVFQAMRAHVAGRTGLRGGIARDAALVSPASEGAITHPRTGAGNEQGKGEKGAARS